MLSCRKGSVCLFQGLLLLGFVGCSSVFQGEKPYTNEIPVSNAQVAQKVIELALENAGIPYGKGTEVSYKVDGDSEEDNLLRIIALEFLLKHGYRVVEKKESSPIHSGTEIRFGLDTLYVNLYPRLDPRPDRGGGSHTTKMSKLTCCTATRRVRRHSDPPAIVVRRAGAQIGAVFLYPRLDRGSGVKKVYKGIGVLEDTFPFQMLESVGEGESFTTIFSAQDRIIKNVQPFLLGITMTTLVWLLYSYRG